MGLITTEIRYFFEEEPSELWEIRDLLNLSAEAERTDQYLLMDESATCGVKIREGRFEIKSLVKRHPNSMGQSWEKLSLDIDISPGKMPHVPVKKTRWVAYFNSKLHKIDPTTDVNCQVEISMAVIANVRYWSLCLEAGNGDEPNRLKVLQDVFAQLRSRFDLLNSVDAQSCQKSYPQLLLETGL